MRAIRYVWLTLAAVASPAMAQWIWENGAEREGVIKPKMSYPVGNPDAIGRMAWDSLKVAARHQACEKFGCLILVNDSPSYRLLGFYVRPVAPKADTDWGPNQLDHVLGKNEGAIRFKLADDRFCNWPVRFVMRHAKTKEVVPIETTAALCAKPHQDTVLRVRIVRPEVRVEG